MWIQSDSKRSMYAALLVGITFFAWSGVDLQAREWTNAQGVKIDAEFVEVIGEAEARAVSLRVSDGRTFEIALSKLSETDRAYVQEEIEKAARPSLVKRMLKGNLVALNGDKLTAFEQSNNPEYYALYFSASWCGPCLQFTPELTKYYNSSSQAGKKFEVILVCRDKNQAAMTAYMKDYSMRWPAVAFRKGERLESVEKYTQSGIPCLVLIDRHGGVLSHSFVDGNYLGPMKVLVDMRKIINGG